MIVNKVFSVIDFGTSKISIAMGKKKGDTFQYFGIGTCEYAGFREGMWLAPDDLEESIFLAKKDLEYQSGRKVRDVYVSIPGEFTRTFFSHVSSRPINLDGRITTEDVEQLMDQGMQNLPWPDDYGMLHKSPVVYLLDGISRRQSPVEQYARDFEGFISYTAADQVFAEDISVLLDGLGMGAIGFFAANKALAEAVQYDSQKKTVIIIDAGYYSTDVIIYENGGIIFHENIPLGGYHITSDLMIRLNKEYDYAELIKRNCAIGMDSLGLDKIMLDDENARISFSVDEAQYIIENRVNEIMGIVLQDIEKTGMQLDNRCGVFLTGGGMAKIKGVREVCSNILGQTVRVYRPKQPIQVTELQATVCAGLEYVAKRNGKLDEKSSDELYNMKYTGLFR